MPAKNTVKIYIPETYYHVYNRGASKQIVFKDEEDYTVFLHYLKRYLSKKTEQNFNRLKYTSLRDKVKLHAFCLMPNHFHLLLYQITEDGMRELLKRVTVSYGMYFNKKYHHVGVVFQQRYRAVPMKHDSQFAHITRYIHMNPKEYNSWKWSSLPYYLGYKSADWVEPYLIDGREKYQQFLDDYRERRDELAELKDELAG